MKWTTTTTINALCYENKLTFPIYNSDQKFKKSIGFCYLKMKTSHITCIQRFMFHKTKSKNKKYFCGSCLQYFSRQNVSNNHKENYLKINGKQDVKLEKRATEFKNLFKKILVPFKIYSDYSVACYEGFCPKEYQDHIPCSFAYKLVCIDDRFSKPIVVYRGENAAYKFFEAILEECEYCKKVVKNHFNKNLIMTEEEKQF